MYSKRSNLILGFHGCAEKVAQAIVSGEQKMKPSNNDYDWLGGGYLYYPKINQHLIRKTF